MAEMVDANEMVGANALRDEIRAEIKKDKMMMMLQMFWLLELVAVIVLLIYR